MSTPPIIKTPKLIDESYSVLRKSMVTTRSGTSHSLAIDADQTRTNHETTLSLFKHDDDFNVDENFTLQCSIDLEKDILNEPAIREEVRASSPIAIDTFRYNLQGSRKEWSVDAQARRESATFVGVAEPMEQAQNGES